MCSSDLIEAERLGTVSAVRTLFRANGTKALGFDSDAIVAEAL